LKIHLLVIDPQNDFTDRPGNIGSLAVAGAHADMQRLTKFVEKVGHKLDDIHVTLDTHRRLDIAHRLWWVNPSSGKHPDPFTLITLKDFNAGIWRPVDSSAKNMALMKDYLESLEKQARYVLIIWPEHCLIGTPGNNVHPDLAGALSAWEEKEVAWVDYVTKGSNPYTEHYSAVKAEVPNKEDPSTQLNDKLVKTLKAADVVILAGEALSHCLAYTARDIADYFGDENVSKLVLLQDCTSPVTGAIDFTPQGEQFIKEMQKRGMKVENSTTFLQ
jgi:nicotinamidase/pyrazinamidase